MCGTGGDDGEEDSFQQLSSKDEEQDDDSEDDDTDEDLIEMDLEGPSPKVDIQGGCRNVKGYQFPESCGHVQVHSTCWDQV